MQASPLNDVRKLLTGPSKRSSLSNEVMNLPAARPTKQARSIKVKNVLAAKP